MAEGATVESKGPGGIASPPGVAELGQDDWKRIMLRAGLSPRQAEVVRALLEGKTVEAAATKLNIRPDTVKTYVKRIYRRLSVNSRVALALKIMSLRR